MEQGNFRQINWQDGMKLNKWHFGHTDNFHIEQHVFNRNLLLNENNFGLLPESGKTGAANEIKISLDGDFINIIKFRVFALMLNGMYVKVNTDEVTANNIDVDSLRIKFKYTDYDDKTFALVLKTNSFRGIECGKFDSEEFPLKRPFLLPHFEFILMPLKKLKESYFSDDFFIFLKFKIDGNQLSIDENYIPPVTSLISHSKLVDFHSNVLTIYNSIENHLIEISKKHSKIKGNNFSDTVVLLSNSLIMHLSSVRFEIKHKLLYEPPLELIIRIKSLANTFSKILETRTSIGKDAFLNEVIRVLGTSKNEFEELLKQITNLEYHHYDINESLSVVGKFLISLNLVFKVLSEGEQKPNTKQIDIKIKR